MHKNMYYKNLIIDIFAVTFRKEGVDWNATDISGENLDKVSPSARKVWIEMYNHDNDGQYGQIVTFRKEGVDWNHLRLLP